MAARHRSAAFVLTLAACSPPSTTQEEGKAAPRAVEPTPELTDVVPFLVEEMLAANGGKYTKADDWQPHIAVEGHLITGQNPASSVGVAEAVLAQLKSD